MIHSTGELCPTVKYLIYRTFIEGKFANGRVVEINNFFCFSTKTRLVSYVNCYSNQGFAEIKIQWLYGIYTIHFNRHDLTALRLNIFIFSN